MPISSTFTLSTVVSVSTAAVFSQPSAILMRCVSGSNFSTVRFLRLPGVFSTVRVSPTSSCAPVFAATSAAVKLRCVTAADVPRSVLRSTIRASSTFFSIVVVLVTSKVFSSVFRIDFCLVTPFAASPASFAGAVGTFSSFTSRCSKIVFWHSLAISPTGSFVVFSTVLFQSSPGVFSLRLVSPTSSPLPFSGFAADLSVVDSTVPRSVLRQVFTAPFTFFSVVTRFTMSLVQSGFFVTWRSTITPFLTLAFLPVEATLSALTPRCCSSWLSSNAVTAVSYSATSCCTVSRFSTM